MSPGNTATLYDGMSYPFIRFWHHKANASFVGCLKQTVHHGNRDWHQGEVVLIRKADKLRCDVVKAWLMIHLLPVMAKGIECIVLLAVAKHVDLEDTQFGSRWKRGVHDALAVVYEFLKTHKNWHPALLSMDVEGGFDRLDIDLLADLLVARDCPSGYVSRIWHWASQRGVRFNFNGHIFSEYFFSKGIPQGSPLSPFLFGVYVVDIFRPQLQYCPSLRSITVSYVDDAGIVLAADSQEMVRGELERVFDECTVVAKGRGMDFSGPKTKWIGFGDEVWGPCRLDGVQVSAVNDLRVLGMRFACDGSMRNHVDYWLQGGLEVRGRIGALARRFGGESGIGAWEVMRLVQGAYLPMVEYGLEFVADDLVAIKKIEVHVRDCLGHCLGCPYDWQITSCIRNVVYLLLLFGRHTTEHGLPSGFSTIGTVTIYRGMVGLDRMGACPV